MILSPFGWTPESTPESMGQRYCCVMKTCFNISSFLSKFPHGRTPHICEIYMRNVVCVRKNLSAVIDDLSNPNNTPTTREE